MPDSVDFDTRLDEGLNVDVEAHWGAGFLAGRYLPGEPSWTWPQIVRPYLAGARRLLDMGTGDGAQLLTLAPLPELTVAYEEWWPTVPAAVAALRPRAVHLIVCLGSDENTVTHRTRPGLPFAGSTFDVITNRHEAFDAADVARLLRPGGHFVTQQVGGADAASVRALLGLGPPVADWSSERARRQLAAAGLTVVASAEERRTARFADIAALVAYVRSTPWMVPEFDPAAMRDRLLRLHERCAREGDVEAVSHRFWVAARRPDG